MAAAAAAATTKKKKKRKGTSPRVTQLLADLDAARNLTKKANKKKRVAVNALAEAGQQSGGTWDGAWTLAFAAAESTLTMAGAGSAAVVQVAADQMDYDYEYAEEATNAGLVVASIGLGGAGLALGVAVEIAGTMFFSRPGWGARAGTPVLAFATGLGTVGAAGLTREGLGRLIEMAFDEEEEEEEEEAPPGPVLVNKEEGA